MKMEELLRHQPEVTLSNWLMEKGVERTGDDVRDIMSYYSFVSEANGDSESVFTNNEVLLTIVEQSESYMHSILNLVNKSFNTVLTSMGYDVVKCREWYRHYTRDITTRMDWLLLLHLDRDMYTQGGHRLTGSVEYYLMKYAAASGYWFKPIPEARGWIDYAALMNAVAKNSDCRERYYRLFVCFMAASEEQRDNNYDSTEEDEGVWVNYTLAKILQSSIRSGDQRIFDFVWNEEDLDLLENVDYFTCIYLASYYNRTAVLRKFTDPPFMNNDDNVNFVLTSAYCGDHYDEIFEYFDRTCKITPPTYNEMWEIINGCHVDPDAVVFDLKNLGLLTRLLSGCELVYDDRLIYNLLWLMDEIDYTLDEFKELWSVMGERCNCVEYVIGRLLGRRRYGEVRYLMTGKEEYDDLDIEYICSRRPRGKRAGRCERTQQWIMRVIM